MNANRLARRLIPILVLFVMAYFFSQTKLHRFGSQSAAPVLSYDQFVQDVDANQVLGGTFVQKTNTFQGTFFRGDEPFTVNLPPESSGEYTHLIARLQAHRVRYGFRRAATYGSAGALLVSLVLPLVIIFFFWTFFLRRARMASQDWKSRSL